jgi:adenylate cyclase
MAFLSNKTNGGIVLLFLAVAGLAAVGLTYFRARGSSVESVAPIDSVAVLPFASTGAPAGTDDVSGRITEGVIDALSRVQGLRVLPRSAVLRYQGRQVNAQDVAKDLNVGSVLAGVVEQRDDNIIVTAQLLDASGKLLIWAGRYDRKISDLPAIEKEIAAGIAEKLFSPYGRS